MEKKPELKLHSDYEAELVVESGDISFRDVAKGKVLIEVQVCNAGVERSEPTVMVLESAPLGAFVPWRPLAQVLVPALEPGESHIVTTLARRPTPVPLGSFDRVPPRKLLTALSAPDQQPAPAPANPNPDSLTRLMRLFRTAPSPVPSDEEDLEVPGLASDPWDLLGNRQPYWAGNINVFVGRRPVERHIAQALRIYPGRTNLVMFVVGSPNQPDAFAFELVGLPPDWKATMYDMAEGKSLLPGPTDPPILEKRWVQSNHSMMIILGTAPPAGCTAGNLAVHVTRKSTRESAVVEFDLDPAAKGSGCYYL